MKEIDIIKEMLLENGFDVIINKEKILLLRDGFSHSTPIENLEVLIKELHHKYKQPLTEIAGLLADFHLVKKCIERGEEIPGRKLTPDELFDELKDHFGKDE